jgi:hypothetical protein
VWASALQGAMASGDIRQVKAVLTREPELLQDLATGGTRRVTPNEQRGNEALLVRGRSLPRHLSLLVLLCLFSVLLPSFNKCDLSSSLLRLSNV